MKVNRTIKAKKSLVSNFDRLIARKAEAFRSELESDCLNAEQRRIWNAFVFRRSKPYRFVVDDSYGNTIRFVLYTNKTDDGVLHILAKHYNGNVGAVTAQEIVRLCDVVRNGSIKATPAALSYTWRTDGRTYTLTVALKRTAADENVLKSFYSSRKGKASGTAGSSSNDCGANSKSRCKVSNKKSGGKQKTKKSNTKSRKN